MRSRLVCAAILAAAVLPFLPALLRGEIYTVRDHTDYFIPLRHYTTQQLLTGELPLWNPLNGSGERWLANPQTAVFYPPALIFLVFPFATAYVLYLAMHVVVLAAGAFLLFRRWTGVEAAFLAAVSLALAGPVMSLLDVSNNLGTFAWFPFVILAALRRGDADGGYPLPVNVLLLAALFLGGEPFLTVVGAIIFVATMFFSGGRRSLPTILASGGLAMLLCAAQLLPFGEMLIGSDRAAGFAHELAFRESMRPSDWALLSLSPALTSAGLLPSSQSYIPVLYLGIPAVFLALAGVVAGVSVRGGPLRRPILGFSTLLAVAILLSAGSYLGPGAELLTALGMNVNRYPARLVPLGALAVAGLAALGAASLKELRPAARTVSAITFALILLTASRMMWHGSGNVRPEALILLAAELVILVWLMIQPGRAALLVVLAMIVIPDLILASGPLRESRPFPRETPAVAAFIDRNARIARLSDLDMLPADVRYESLPGYTNLSSGVHNISSPAPVSSASYARFHDEALYGADATRLRFLSAGSLVTTRSLRMNGLSPSGVSGPIRVYTFDTVWPAATVWDEPGPSFLAFDETRSSSSGEPRADSSAELIRMDSDEAIVRVSSAHDSMVVLNQLDARGWSVTVDGARADSLRLGRMFRAVLVPAGEHTVRWRYMPDFFLAGVVISVSTVLLLVAMTIHLSNRARGVVGWRPHAKDDDFVRSSHHGSSGFNTASP